jgi:hypothetical protein
VLATSAFFLVTVCVVNRTRASLGHIDGTQRQQRRHHGDGDSLAHGCSSSL